MRILKDRPMATKVVICRGKQHRIVLMAGGAIVPLNHPRAERADMAAAAALGDPCGCQAVLSTPWTLTAVREVFELGAVWPNKQTARVWRRMYRRRPLWAVPPKKSIPNPTTIADIRKAIVAALGGGKDVSAAEWAHGRSSVKQRAAELVSISPNRRLRTRTGYVVTAGGAEFLFDDRFDTAATLGRLAAAAESHAIVWVTTDRKQGVIATHGERVTQRMAAIKEWAAAVNTDEVEAVKAVGEMLRPAEVCATVTHSYFTKHGESVQSHNDAGITVTLQVSNLPLSAIAPVQRILADAAEGLRRVAAAARQWRSTRYRGRDKLPPEDVRDWYRGRISGVHPMDL
jgi:hypothetical protein